MQNSTALFFLIILLLIVVKSLQQQSIGSIAADHNAQSGSKSIFQATLGTTNVGRFKYQDGEIILSQNQQKSSDFFFTPFPHIEPNLTECYYNELSGHNELILTVSLYTPHLLKSVEHYIKQHHNICRTDHCDVSLLPMHSIRLSQKGLRTSESRQKYTLDNEWHSNTQLRQSIEFIIYTSNISVCEHLQKVLSSRCRISNFEVHYLLHGQQTAARKLEITTEHITSTTMYNQIRSQFPSNQQDIVALTGNDYKHLLTDIMDQITLNLRIEEGYEGLQDPVAIDQILERQLQAKQIQLKAIDDHLWNSLYWTSDLTRPDRLSKVLNQIIKQDSIDSDKFHYNHSQVNEALKQHLQQHEKQKLDDLGKHLATQSHNTTRTDNVDVDVGLEVGGVFFDILPLTGKVNTGVNVHGQKTNNTNLLTNDFTHNKSETNRLNNTDIDMKNATTRTMQRKDTEKLVNYISQHVQLEGDIIRPKPIDVKLVKLGSLKSNTKLFSNTVLVKTRTDVHILPLRCPYEQRIYPISPVAPADDKCDHSSNLLNNMTSIINILHEKLMTDLNQKFIENFHQLERSMNLMKTDLMKKIEQNENLTHSTINQITKQLRRNSLSIAF